MKTKTLSLILALSLTLSTSFTFAVGLSVTVSTDKANYQASEQVKISGKVLADSTPAVDALVGILIKDSEGNPIISRSFKTQADGTFNLIFILPSVAKGGSYTVRASGSYKGQTASAETTFIVTPTPTPTPTPTTTTIGPIISEGGGRLQILLAALLIVILTVAVGAYSLKLRAPPVCPRCRARSSFKGARYCRKCGWKLAEPRRAAQRRG